MPRRKKPDQSPARTPGGPPDGGSLDHNTGHRGPRQFDSVMAENVPSSAPLSGSVKEGIIKGMQEMFSHLDPDVIYIVLSECDFKGSTCVPTCYRVMRMILINNCVHIQLLCFLSYDFTKVE